MEKNYLSSLNIDHTSEVSDLQGFESDKLKTSEIKMAPKTFGVESIPEDQKVTMPTVQSLETSQEVIAWSKLLDVLMRGPSKPNSPVFELTKVDKAITKAANRGQDTTHLERLRDSIANCCPTQSTVNDALMYKDQRAAVMSRIADITGIDKYMLNGRRFSETSEYPKKDSSY